MTQAESPSSNENLQAIHEMSSYRFMELYSQRDLVPPAIFSSIAGIYFTTTEIDYYKPFPEITVKGGLHLAVMGGLDPAFGQIAFAEPELSLICEINPTAIPYQIAGRVNTLATASNGEEYAMRIREYYLQVLKKLDPRRHDYPILDSHNPSDWTYGDSFQKVKRAVQKGKVKFFPGDIVSHGLSVASEIAHKTGVPLNLLYVSNIFDYPRYNNPIKLAEKLGRGLEEGWIAPNAQIIDASSLISAIYRCDQYIELNR